MTEGLAVAALQPDSSVRPEPRIELDTEWPGCAHDDGGDLDRPGSGDLELVHLALQPCRRHMQLGDHLLKRPTLRYPPHPQVVLHVGEPGPARRACRLDAQHRTVH